MDRFYVAANVPSSRMNRTLWICLVGSLFLCMSLVNAVPYTKYGRSCKDIGCRSTEVCVIKEDPCSYETRECGKYPTCVRAGSAGQPSCETKVCPVRQYCKTVNGIPTCVDTSPNLAPGARRPGGVRRPQFRPVKPTPPPRSSSRGYGGRYSGSSGNSVGIPIWGLYRGGNADADTNGGRGSQRQGQSSYNRDQNYYNTHVATDNKGNRVWTFSG